MPRGDALIEGTTFHLLSSDDVRRRSVVEVFEHVLTDRSGEPKINGVLDLRLGTVEPRFRCATCGGTVRTCAGHAGHIELPFPVYNVIFLPQILLVLRCLCCACARPLLLPERIRDLTSNERRPQDRLAKVASVAKDVAACPHDGCGMPVCSYAKTTASSAAADGVASTIVRQWSPAARARMTPDDRSVFAGPFTSCAAHVLFSLVSDADWQTLGFDRSAPTTSNPRDMIITTLVVPPAIIRPTSFHYDSGQGRGTNDLTAALQDIVRQAGKVRALLSRAVFDDDVVRTLGADDGTPMPTDRGPIDSLVLFESLIKTPPSPTLLTAVALLQQCVTAYIFNDPRSVAPTSTSGGTAASVRRQTIGGASSQRSGAPRTSVLGRLKGNTEQGGKVGRWRHSCLGKRSDNTARSVIVPDPALDIDELGVPRRIANTLAVRERVCAYNLKDLTRRVRLGAADGGAMSIIRAADADIGCGSAERDATIDLRSYDAATHGSLVLQIGDMVERHLRDGDTIVFNRQPSLHRKSMMSFRVRIVPNYAFHLNPAVTTPFNADYDGDEMNAHVPTDPKAVAEAKTIMSVGAQLLSGQTNAPCAGLVQDGIIGCWRLTDPRVRVSRTDAMDYVMQLEATHRVDGSIAGRERLPAPADPPFWTGLQIASLPLPRDFSWSNETRTTVVERGEIVAGRLDKRAVGPGGALLGAIVRKCGSMRALVAFSDLQRIALRFLEQRGFSCGARDSVLGANHDTALARNVERVIRATYSAAFDTTVAGTRLQREIVVVRNLGSLMDRIGRALPDVLPSDNALVEMHRSGAKGNAFNLCQITAALGQTLVEGRRPNPRADDSMMRVGGGTAALGTTTTPPFLPCCCAPRPGSRPNPVRLAADRGFIRESYVRGLNPKAYFMHAMGGREGLVDTAVRTAESGYAQRKLMKALEDLKIEHDGTVRDAAANIVQFRYGGDGYEPAELIRQRVDNRFAGLASLIIDRIGPPSDDVRCTFPFYLDDVTRVADEHTGGNDDNTLCGDPFDDPDVAGELTLCESSVLRDLLNGRSPKAVRAALRFATAASDRARVHPGESVGCSAAHSIAQPATQMTLNSFHVAGKSQRHALGLGRLYELIDVRGKRETLSVTVEIPVREPWMDRGAQIARDMKRALVGITLRTLVARFEVVLTYCALPTIGADTSSLAAWRKLAAAVAETKCDDPGEARWLAWAVALGEIDCVDEKRRPHDRCLRFELSPAAMAKHNVDLETVRSAVETVLCGGTTGEHRADWIVVAGTGVAPVIRVCCTSARGRSGKSAGADGCAARGRQLLSSVLVRGVRGVATVEFDTGARMIRVFGCEALGAVLATQCEALDYDRLYCNSPIACAARLGLDYAGMVLASELWRVMRSNGTYIDARHVLLLADSMTHRGYMVPTNRHGLNRLNTDPIVRCCFEQPTDVIRNAALHSESSIMRSVSERVVFGQPIPLGTGTVEVREPETRAQAHAVPTSIMHCTEVGLMPDHFCDLGATNRAELVAYMQPAPAMCAPVPPRLANVWRAGIELLAQKPADADSSSPSIDTADAAAKSSSVDESFLLPPNKRAAQSLSDARDPLRLGSGRRRGTLRKYRLAKRIRSSFRPSTPARETTNESALPAVVSAAEPACGLRVSRRIATAPWRPWSPGPSAETRMGF